MNNNNIIIIIISFFSFVFIFTQLVEGQQNFTNYNKDINTVIGDLMQKCSDLHNDACIAVVATIDSFCAVAYFPNCFGSEAWNPYMQYLKEMIKEGHIVRDDPYVTLNNEHFGNDSINSTGKME